MWLKRDNCIEFICSICSSRKILNQKEEEKEKEKERERKEGREKKTIEEIGDKRIEERRGEGKKRGEDKTSETNRKSRVTKWCK